MLSLLLLSVSLAHAATFQIRSTDDPNEGLNDPTLITPTGGNPATTLGQARMAALQEAGRIWGLLLQSDVTIVVDAAFDDLNQCSASSGTLGGASPGLVHVNFPGAPLRDVFYVSALADALSGMDRNGLTSETAGIPDIDATFNTAVDANPSCLGGRKFYYGFDHNKGVRVDFLAVALHELGHGLGFAPVINLNTGDGIRGSDGVERFSSYVQFAFDEQLNLPWPQMTGAQRAQSARRTGSLVWSGREVTSHLNRMMTGISSGGRLRLFAPSTLQGGSSVSHWDTAATPDLLMEPNISANLGNFTDMTACAFKDMGWRVTRCPDVSVNSRPIVTPLQFTIAEDTPGTLDFHALDADGDGVTFAIVTQPAKGTLSSFSPAPSLNSPTYAPAANVNGTDTFTVTANDGIETSVAGTITVVITPVNDAPSLSSTSASAQSGGSTNVPGIGADVDGDTLTYTIVTAPANGTATGGSVMTYRANNGFTGTDSFTYAASDGRLSSAAATVTVSVTAPPKSGGGGGGVMSLWLLFLLAGLSRLRSSRINPC